ncbi:MAG: MarR family winged helix-turn-helix transcriptional regulator [Planctomycetota bacterium]|jgi:DNA-binding MarR family transcriptional regulator
MSLTHELGLRRRIELLPHEALLNIYYTASCLKKRADEFFRGFGLTDVQFNVMMLLHYQSGEEGGLSQAQLSDMMLVNRANITSLIDRMEKAELVVRTAAPGDRRYNIVKLTSRGRKLVAKVEPLYAREVQEVMAVFKLGEQKRLVAMLEKVRSKLSKQ